MVVLLGNDRVFHAENLIRPSQGNYHDGHAQYK